MLLSITLIAIFINLQIVCHDCAVLKIRPRMLTKNWDLDWEWDILSKKVCESEECALEDKPMDSNEVEMEHEENYLTETRQSDNGGERQKLIYNHLMVMEQIMDRNADPCENFYQYACGNYERVFSVPQHKKIYNVFDVLLDKLLHNLRDVLERKLDYDKSERIYEKAWNLYESCMNGEAIKNSGVSPLLKFIEAIGGWPILKGVVPDGIVPWMNVAAELGRIDFNFLFKHSIEIEKKRGSEYMIRLEPPISTTLSLGSDNHINMTQIGKYRVFVANILELLGARGEIAAETAAEIVYFEEALAMIPELETYNTSKIMRIAELQKTFPGIGFAEYFRLIYGNQMDMTQEVVVYSEKYFKHLSEMINDTESRVLVDYILWKLTELYFIILGKNFENYEDNLDGEIFEENSWLECASLTTNSLEEIVRQMYLDKYFNESNKHDVTEIVDDLHESFASMITESIWLDASTKSALLDKLNVLNIQVGYPDNMITRDQLARDYLQLDISPEQYFENILNINRYSVRKSQKFLGQKFNDREIRINFMSTTAHYKFSKNSAVIPAALLQPPLYHLYHPMPMKLGVVGSLIAHEITHGFSGNGRYFDYSGKKQTLWSEPSIRGYEKRTQCFIQQYNNYTFNGHPVNGTSSVGENICDNNGLRMSYRVFKKWLHQNGNSAAIWTTDIHPSFNVTNSQLFFLSYAQFMCTKVKPEGVSTFINSARHPPPETRIIGTLSNLPEFGMEFSCPRGSRMNPVKKCRIY